MRLRSDQINANLARGLAPVYLISGDEPLQREETGDAIRAAARRQGYADRLVFNVGTGFDWDAMRAEFNALSLFAQRRVIELRLAGGKLDKHGAAAVVEYCERPAADTVLLIVAGKLERDTQSAEWVRQCESRGVHVQVWPVDAQHLPQWIERRLAAKGLQPSADAVALLAERVEGNLLAAAQEIDKLVLLFGSGPLGLEQVVSAVADSARFDVYGVADAALDGDATRVARMIDGLRAEGEDPILVLWALSREIRALAQMAQARQAGASIPAVLGQFKVWEKRKPYIERALQRHNPRRWPQLLRRCAHVDRVIKGRADGDAWDELREIALAVGGVHLFGPVVQRTQLAAR
jgi:DNA polymerase-3 subunit delta